MRAIINYALVTIGAIACLAGVCVTVFFVFTFPAIAGPTPTDFLILEVGVPGLFTTLVGWYCMRYGLRQLDAAQCPLPEEVDS